MTSVQFDLGKGCDQCPIRLRERDVTSVQLDLGEGM